ncbi:MAG: acyl-CoA dehydrogenase family protein [Sulfolobales archaeon]
MESELDLIRRIVREYSEKRIRDIASVIDKENRYPREIIRELGFQGLLAPNIPPEMGGGGLGLKGACVVLEELARYSGSISLIVEVQGILVSHILQKYGSRRVREEILPKIASGEYIASFALSEPCCGSDAAAIESRAERIGGEWVIKGVKTWITQGLYADYFIVFARTGPREERHRNIAAFLVRRSECTKTSPIEVMGFRGTGTAEIILEGCHADDDSVLAGSGSGFKAAMDALNVGRIAISSIGLGLAEESLDEAYRFLRSRRAFDREIIEFQYIQFLLSDLYTLVETSRSLVYKAAEEYDSNPSSDKIPLLAAVTKNFVAPISVHVVGEALRLLGGYGYSRESSVERMYRDVKLLEIGEGTNEVQKLVISRYILRDGFKRLFN